LLDDFPQHGSVIRFTKGMTQKETGTDVTTFVPVRILIERGSLTDDV
jgi:hypothetical protein